MFVSLFLVVLLAKQILDRKLMEGSERFIFFDFLF